MTISSTTRIAGPYTGSGTTGPFTFAFKVFQASDLVVVKREISTATDTVLTLTTDYSVTLNGNQNSSPGGSVTLVSSISSSYELTLTSDIENKQPTDLTNQGGFYPEVITDALDRACIQIQQLASLNTRSLVAPISDGLSTSLALPAADLRANKYLAFDANGVPMAADGTDTPNITSAGNMTITANNAGSDAARDVIFYDNATETMRVLGSGATSKVGIGTAAPQAVLDLGAQGQGRGITWAAAGTSPNNNIFSAYSGAGLVFAAGMAPNTSSDAYVSPNALSIGRAAIRLDALSGSLGSIKFYTDAASSIAVGSPVTPTERMRITSAGEVWIAGTTDQGAYNLQCNGTGVWGAGAYVNGSDSRIKHDINPIGSCLDLVAAIEPVTFVYNADWSSDQTLQTGFIAQQLQIALAGQPYLDGIVSQGGEYLNVAYQNIIPLLTKSIQELKAIVEAQAARIAALEANA